MRSRLLALAAAVAMVVVAVQVRAGFDERAAEGRPRIVCAGELAAVCEAVDGDADVVVEPAGLTADRLVAAGDDLGLDAWIAPGPWAELVRSSRERALRPPGLTAGAPVARARLAVAVWPGRLPGCGADVGWPCLVQATTVPTFKIGLPDARRDGLGLVVLGSLARSLSPENPLDDDAFRGALDALAGAALRPPPKLATVLAGGPAFADAHVTAEAGADTGGRMELAYPAPVVTADVVPAQVPGERGRRAAELLRGRRVAEALRAAGWDTSPGAEPSGLPDVGVLEALRDLWAEVAR
ncbi:MAG TPA: hypothetical protein VHF47_04320 [Acidimicrobiales bacterium]|nr:hypothetical protein [Acidimicrobiales bacterium]